MKRQYKKYRKHFLFQGDNSPNEYNRQPVRHYLLVLVFSLISCTRMPLEYRGSRVGHYNFNYEIEAPQPAGLIQVFDDREKTYFKVYRAEEKEIPRFYTQDSQEELKATPLPSNMLVIDGIYPQVEVRKGNRSSIVSQIPVEKRKVYNANSL